MTSRQPAPEPRRPEPPPRSSRPTESHAVDQTGGTARATDPDEQGAQFEDVGRTLEVLARATIARATLRELNRCNDALQVEAALAVAAEGESARGKYFREIPRVEDGPTLAHETSRLGLAASAERERVIAGTLNAAAAGLVSALDTLVDSPIVWDSLVADARELATHPIRRQDLATVEEIVAVNLPELLRALGYRPPPPATFWVEVIQDPLRGALFEPADGPSPDRAISEARQQLRFLIYRLRELIRRSYAALTENVETGDGVHELSGARRLLSSAVRAARATVIPAVIAAGTVAAVAAAPHVTLGAALFAGTGAAGLEGVRQVVEAAAVQLLRRPAPPAADPRVEVSAQLAGLRRAMGDLYNAESRDNAQFIARRCVYAALAAADFAGAPAWERAYPLLHALNEFPINMAEQAARFDDFAWALTVDPGPGALWNQMSINEPPYEVPVPDSF